jgi:hypothetical protein
MWMAMERGFTFMCSRCGEKPAIAKQGRKVFLCATCASDVMWQEMVGTIITGETEDDEVSSQS